MTKQKEIEIAIEKIENNSHLLNLPEYAEIVRIFRLQRLINWLKDYRRLLDQKIEQKIGHWIVDTYLGYYVSTCSNCNWRGHGDEVLIYKPKYCPNCGAEMIESEK